MSRQYAVKDRDQTIQPEASRKVAQRDQKAYGGMIMQSKASGHDLIWKPWKRHRVFLWVFLAIQAIFIRQRTQPCSSRAERMMDPP